MISKKSARRQDRRSHFQRLADYLLDKKGSNNWDWEESVIDATLQQAEAEAARKRDRQRLDAWAS